LAPAVAVDVLMHDVGVAGVAVGLREHVHELIIDDDAVIGPSAMIDGGHIGRGSVVEPGAVVYDGNAVGAESILRAGPV
jgi:carbonic anhydrase/acetyltransferase-like protein (isoleucine patch superfamily)